MMTLNFHNPNTEGEELVMLDKIIRIGKSRVNGRSLIYLIDGTALETSDSIKTLQARIESGNDVS